MIRLTLIILFLVVLGSCSVSKKVSLAGYRFKDYSLLRPVLITKGSHPIDETQNPQRMCNDGYPLCDKYPELVSCAVDVYCCQFEWKDSSNRRFEVVTCGDKPVDLEVEQINYRHLS
jgi:hypothetical protein